MSEKGKRNHPLNDLAPPKGLSLAGWKEIYASPEEFRDLPMIMTHFWYLFRDSDDEDNEENVINEDWSIWRIDYKYNDSLTSRAMSLLVINDLFETLTPSIDYMFGRALVFGENGEWGIVGAFLVRGQDAELAFNVSPTWKCFTYTKLDPFDDNDIDFVENNLAWGEPIIPINRKQYPILDSRVLS